MFCFRLRRWLRLSEMQSSRFAVSGCPCSICYLATNRCRAIVRLVFRLPLGAHQRQPENQSPQPETAWCATKQFCFQAAVRNKARNKAA